MDEEPTRASGEVVAGKELIEQSRLARPNWDALENIYARILHGLSPRIRQQFDSFALNLGCK
jgi:hypothetical protein